MRHSRIRNTEGNITFRLEEGETFLVLRCLELNLMFPCRTTNMSLFPYQSSRRACWKANLVHCLKKAFRWWFLDTWQLTIFSLFFIIFSHCKFARKYKSRMFSWKLEKKFDKYFDGSGGCLSFFPTTRRRKRFLYSPLAPSRHNID